MNWDELGFNPLMHNVQKWSKHFKNLAANAARF